MATLQQQMENAQRIIDQGALPDVTIAELAEPEEDQGDVCNDLDELMKDIVIKQPEMMMMGGSDLAMLPPAVIVTHSLDLADVLQQLGKASRATESNYRTRALQAEIAFKNILGRVVSQPDKQILQLSCAYSRQIHKAILKYKKLCDWYDADLAAKVEKQRQVMQQHVAAIQSVVQQQKAQHRKEIQAYINAWVAIVNRYLNVLDKISSVLDSMLATKDSTVVRESTKLASALTAVIRDILKEGLARVTNLSDPIDAFDVLSILRHAIHDSTSNVQSVLKDCIGVRPDFDESRNRELEDALRKTKEDIKRSEASLEEVKASALKPSITLDEDYGLRQTISGLEARLESARRLEEVLATDLRDADVQKIITTLNSVCQKQAAWQEASAKLALLCDRKRELLQAQYREFSKQLLLQQQLFEREVEELKQQAKVAKEAARVDLDRTVYKDLRGFAEALKTLEASHVLILPGLVNAVKDHLYSRVLLEYAQL